MKKKPTIWSSVSILIASVLAITVFTRNDMQLWLNALVFTIWAIWATIKFLIPYLDEKIQEQEARKIREMYEQEEMAAETNSPETTDIVLLRHVNYRISSYLKSAYPDATWEWREENPEQIVASGGIGRIQIYGAADFNFADITVNKNADIKCDMLKIVPLTKLQPDTLEEVTKVVPKTPTDPRIWYEKKGRVVLENLITDLNSRGYSQLTINENGEIFVKQANTEVKQAVLENMPEKMYWLRLSKLFAEEGLAADIMENSMIVSW